MLKLNYQVRPCVNPNGETGVDYAANATVKTDDYSFDDLCDNIQFACTMTKSDVKALLVSALNFIRQDLLNGERVLLENLGSFQVHLRSKCYKQSLIGTDGFDPADYISGIRVHYRPDKDLTRHLRESVSFQRIPSELMD